MTDYITKRIWDNHIRFYVRFYVPKDTMENPPTATDPVVSTEIWDNQDVYVKSFNCRTLDLSYNTQMKNDLVDALRKNGIRYKDRCKWYKASYDPPFKLFDRRNEVWIPKYQTETKDDVA